jgi:hypothetical protein
MGGRGGEGGAVRLGDFFCLLESRVATGEKE